MFWWILHFFLHAFLKIYLKKKSILLTLLPHAHNFYFLCTLVWNCFTDYMYTVLIPACQALWIAPTCMEDTISLIDWLIDSLISLQMEWSFLSPSDTEPTVFPDQGSLSSHRQHGDGTYSLSSHLTVPSSVSPGTKITCRVSHLALDAPLSVSLVVESPQPGNMWLLFVVIIAERIVWHVINKQFHFSCLQDVSVQKIWSYSQQSNPWLFSVSFTLQTPIGGFWVSWSSLCFSSTRSWDKLVEDILVDHPDLKLSPEKPFCHLGVCKLLLISLKALTGSFKPSCLLLNWKIHIWGKTAV